eukprot:scaffold139_cov324-Prasinococcus_capsulatus_cf.AAC.3
METLPQKRSAAAIAKKPADICGGIGSATLKSLSKRRLPRMLFLKTYLALLSISSCKGILLIH